MTWLPYAAGAYFVASLAFSLVIARLIRRGL